MSNVFSFTGHVGRDAEQRYLPSGQAVLNVTVGSTVGFGDKQQTLWIRVALWGKRAEGELVNYLKKGQQVFVSGELTQREYQQDGVTKTSLELNANILDLVGGRKDSDSRPAQQPAQRPQAQPQQQPRGGDNFDDDIPFASLNWQIRAHLI